MTGSEKHNCFTGSRDGYGSSDERFIKERRKSARKSYRAKRRGALNRTLKAQDMGYYDDFFPHQSKPEREIRSCSYCAESYHRYAPNVHTSVASFQISSKTKKFVQTFVNTTCLEDHFVSKKDICEYEQFLKTKKPGSFSTYRKKMFK